MKKIFACLTALVLTICSCSQKKPAKIFVPNKNYQQYIFTQIQNDKVPQYFKRLMMRPVLQGGSTLYVFEKLYPECTGLYDSAGFYSGECDNGSWVEFLLFSMEEMRYGQEVLDLLETDVQEEIPQTPETEQETADNTPSVEKTLLDSYGRLRILEFGNERFIPQSLLDSQVLVHFSDKNAVRYFYDQSHRLIKKQYWKMASVEDSTLTSTETYEYEDQSRNPRSKNIENDSARIVSFFDENGLVIKAEKYSKEDKENKKLSSLINRTDWKYDDKKRITSQISVDYTYDKSGKLKNKSEKKEIFYYNRADKSEESEENQKMPPDYELYEDGVLKMQTKYESKGNYSTLIVFEPGTSVTTYYEDYAKKKDVYIYNGTEKRVKYYE